MSISPTIVKYVVMGILCAGWLASHHSVMRLDTRQSFHVAAHYRDRRKARFYFLSVWIGLGMAFLSFLCLEALSHVAFDTSSMREWVLGVTRGIGMFGLLIVAAVWSQVGQRASQPNSDGASLTPLAEKKNRD